MWGHLRELPGLRQGAAPSGLTLGVTEEEHAPCPCLDLTGAQSQGLCSLHPLWGVTRTPWCWGGDPCSGGPGTPGLLSIGPLPLGEPLPWGPSFFETPFPLATAPSPQGPFSMANLPPWGPPHHLGDPLLPETLHLGSPFSFGNHLLPGTILPLETPSGGPPCSWGTPSLWGLPLSLGTPLPLDTLLLGDPFLLWDTLSSLGPSCLCRPPLGGLILLRDPLPPWRPLCL